MKAIITIGLFALMSSSLWAQTTSRPRAKLGPKTAIQIPAGDFLFTNENPAEVAQALADEIREDQILSEDEIEEITDNTSITEIVDESPEDHPLEEVGAMCVVGGATYGGSVGGLVLYGGVCGGAFVVGTIPVVAGGSAYTCYVYAKPGGGGVGQYLQDFKGGALAIWEFCNFLD
jgi:hypothetical protein